MKKVHGVDFTAPNEPKERKGGREKVHGVFSNGRF